jgi:hypothetical protein
MFDILLRVHAEESRAVSVRFHTPTSTPTEHPASANLKGCSRFEAGAGAGGTAGAGSAKPPVPGLLLLFLFSTIYGVQAQALFVPQGRRQA